jgi:hypothetical protein
METGTKFSQIQVSDFYEFEKFIKGCALFADYELDKIEMVILYKLFEIEKKIATLEDEKISRTVY